MLTLSQSERDWLAQHSSINVVADEAWPPFIYYEQEQYLGLSTDILKIVAEETGLQINYSTEPWEQALIQLKNKEVDIFAFK